MTWAQTPTSMSNLQRAKFKFYFDQNIILQKDPIFSFHILIRKLYNITNIYVYLQWGKIKTYNFLN